MKAGIVSSKTIAAHGGRLDAGHYLGRTKQTAEEVKKAEENLEQAKRRVVEARRAHADEVARVEQMVRSGEVKPLTD